jgi:hypothetical protein
MIGFYPESRPSILLASKLDEDLSWLCKHKQEAQICTCEGTTLAADVVSIAPLEL